MLEGPRTEGNEVRYIKFNIIFLALILLLILPPSLPLPPSLSLSLSPFAKMKVIKPLNTPVFSRDIPISLGVIPSALHYLWH